MGRLTNLPSSLDSFVGRDDEVTQVADLLEDHRLVTLTGPPGVGKSRLALHVATATRDNYPDGVWLVELAAVSDASHLPRAVAAAVSVPEQPGQSLVDTVVAHLLDRHLLVVLDNCEHLITAAAHLADTLLKACPGLSVLATSREALGIAGEHIFAVVPLAVPDADSDAPADDLVAYPSVRLFCDRAAATRPGFTLTPTWAPAVAEICRRLDGIPLAIELAAATAKVFPPPEIAAHLDERFRILTHGSRSTLPRHQTLLAAVEWSYELLTSSEQAVLRRLSVFAGSGSYQAVEAVCSGGEADTSQVFEVLTSLIDKSLVVADTSVTEARYRLLETIRDFGRDKLAQAGEEDTVRARHAQWFLDLAEQAEPELTGADQQAWLDRIAADYPNFAAALDWAVTAAESEMGVGYSMAGEGFIP